MMWVFELFSPDEWSIIGTLATVIGTAFTILVVVLGWLWYSGRWLFNRKRTPEISPADPAPPAPRPEVGLPMGRPIVGRKQDLATLHAALTAGQDVALTNSGAILAGQGGIGKTTLARAYADQHGDAYAGTLWVEATSRPALAQGICALNTHLGLPRVENAKPEDAIATIAALTQTGARWLIIYDNVETRDDLRKLIPKGHALIVTTRQGEGYDDAFAVQNTDVLPADAAVAFLAREADQQADDDAQALAETLGHLPLALVIAGRLIRKESSSFATARSQIDTIIARAPKNSDYPDSVIGAVRLSYDQLPDDAKLVADLFAWWAPEGLAARLIADAPEGPHWENFRHNVLDQVHSLAESPDRVAEAIEALEDRSLLRRDETGFAMHRMTAAALRAIQVEAPLNGAAAALIAAVYPSGENGPLNSASWPLCRRLTPHVRALMQSGDAPKNAATDYLFNQASVFTEAIGDYAGAVEFARASLDFKSARLSESDRAVAVGHATLGMALQRVGDLDEAEIQFRRAVDLGAEHRPDSVDLAGIHDLLGGLLFDKGRAGDRDALLHSLREYQKSAAILRRHVPKLSHARARALNNLGTVRDALGQTAAGLRLGEYALPIWREILPDGDARLGPGLMNVGAQALKSSAANRAEPLLEEALALWQSVYLEAPQHPEIVNAADWLISAYLIRARAGENAGLREAKAKQLCAEFGFDFDREVEHAKQYPYIPQSD